VSTLGPFGVWTAHLRSRDRGKIAAVAAAVEECGYGTAWIPGAFGGELLGDVDAALAATSRITVATGVLNIWAHDAGEVAAWVRRHHSDRLLLGLGASHPQAIAAYAKPLAAMTAYLDALDAAAVPADQRILAALGPKMLALAGARSLGAHTYFVDVEHTRVARAALGDGPVIAPELKVVLDPDPARARAVARAHLAYYLELTNYTRNLLRTGYTEADLADGGSDRLVDGVVAWGDAESVARRAQAHLDAGADHVCVQVLTADRREVPYEAWKELAAALRQQVSV